MGNYENFRDSLICEKNDHIDNAAQNVIVSVLNKKEEDTANDVKQLVKTLLPNGMAFPDGIDMQAVSGKAKAAIEALGIKDRAWDMGHIAEVETAVENMLDGMGIPVCHPFFTEDDDIDEDDENYDEDNDGILCCLSCDRCDKCPEKNERP